MLKLLTIMVISLTCLIIMNNTSEYSVSKSRDCIVLGKYRVNIKVERYYLILKDERGVKFDKLVGFKTYGESYKGMKINFNIPEKDINPTIGSLIYDFIFTIFLLGFTIPILIILFALLLWLSY